MSSEKFLEEAIEDNQVQIGFKEKNPTNSHSEKQQTSHKL